MVSGIVYFDEIVENIKDATGIDNLRPMYSRIKRWVYNCEQEIGAGGVLVLKKKEYNIGDGWYDGVSIRLPEDFMHEYSYGALDNGILQGNVFKLYKKGPDKIDFKYLGFLLDEEGNPFTTRNRLPAIVAYAVYRIYSSKYFTGQGNHNQYLLYKVEYEDAIMLARGLDAFPSEEDWAKIGSIRLGGTFEAMTDCGMKSICLGTEDPSTLDTTELEDVPSCVTGMEGTINGSAEVIGEISYSSLEIMFGIASGSARADGTLQQGTFADWAMGGQINGIATVTGTLVSYVPTVLCSERFSYSGASGTFQFNLEIGSGIGFSGIKMQPYSVPDRFKIYFNGVLVADSKFIGSSAYEQQLLDLGYNAGDLALTNPAPINPIDLVFYKSTASPSYAIVEVLAPLPGTAWIVDGICPVSSSVGSSTVSGTLTPIGGGVSTVVGILTDAFDFIGIATTEGTLIGKTSMSGTSSGSSEL